MKKKFNFVICLFFVVNLLISCGKVEWHSDFEEAKKIAMEQEKFILLNFSSDKDGLSEKLKKNGFGNEKFLKKYSNNFVFVNLDFSEKFDANYLNSNSTEEELLKAQKIIGETKNSMKVAELYAIRSLPTTLILSKEGYVINSIDFFKIRADFDSNSAENDVSIEDAFEIYDFGEICKEMDDALVLSIDFKNNMKIAYGNGKIEDRIAAIDEIFDSTDFQYRYLLRNLNELALELDTENISGSISKHTMALISAQAVDAGTDFKKAAQIFASGTEKRFLTEDDKQLLFYQAAMASYNAGKEEYPQMKEYILKSINESPNSDKVEILNEMLEQIDSLNQKIK